MSELDVLQKENAELKRIIANLDSSTKMLVKRDLELRRANEQLKSLDATKTEFVAIAAHQLRTPLSAIRWSYELLRNDKEHPLSEQQNTILDEVSHSVERLLKLVNNLLDVGHLDIGTVDLTRNATPQHINALCEDIIQEQQTFAEHKNISLSYTSDGNDAYIVGDIDRLHDIITNLLDNAIKYTPEGGEVTLRLSSDGEQVTLTVTDTGVGIPDEFSERLFQKFARAQNAQTIDPDGTGLGLYIVKKVIELMGGTIQASSVEGEGTTFSVTLPQHTND